MSDKELIAEATLPSVAGAWHQLMLNEYLERTPNDC